MADLESGRTFLGRGWGFPPEFQRHSKEVRMVTEEDDIQESLRILLSTRPGERVMHPMFGCGIHLLVFESMNENMTTEIRDRVERSILFFEPRISLDRVEVGAESVLEGVLQIQLEYTVRATNSRSNLVYPFYFREGTNLSFEFRSEEEAAG